MTWWAPLLTLAGAVVGAAVTLLADRIRWRRDQQLRRHETLRGGYGGYLAALHATSEELRAVSLSEHPADVSRLRAARAAFRSAGLATCREQLVLLAPGRTVRAADRTFTALRELRDAIGHGHDLDSPEYRQILDRYRSALRALRDAMRRDLGNPALGVDVTF